MTANAQIEKTQDVKIITDFWSGAGGTSTGAMQAADELGMDVMLTAVNHWDIAVKTHSINHPKARHFCKAVDSLSPLEIIPGGIVDLFIASPECTHHSNARGHFLTSERQNETYYTN